MLTCFYSFKCIDWWHVMYWKRTTGENGTLSLGVADRGSAFLLSAVVGGPSQVWGVCLEAQASCLVDSDSVLAPCNTYQWNATSSPHFFALQSETLGSPSFWPSVDLHTALFLFLHKWLLANVDLWKEVHPYTHTKPVVLKVWLSLQW